MSKNSFTSVSLAQASKNSFTSCQRCRTWSTPLCLNHASDDVRVRVAFPCGDVECVYLPGAMLMRYELVFRAPLCFLVCASSLLLFCQTYNLHFSQPLFYRLVSTFILCANVNNSIVLHANHIPLASAFIVDNGSFPDSRPSLYYTVNRIHAKFAPFRACLCFRKVLVSPWHVNTSVPLSDLPW